MGSPKIHAPISRAAGGMNKVVKASGKKTASFNIRSWINRPDPNLIKVVGRDAYKTYDWIYILVSLLGREMGTIPWDFIDPSGNTMDQEKQKDDPLIKLYREPWAHVIPSSQKLKEGQTIFLLLDGESFLVPDEIVGGKPTKLKMIPKSQMKEKVDKNGDLVGWEFTPTAKSGQSAKKAIPLKLEEVFQWKLFNPYNLYRGLSPLEAARMMIELGTYSLASNISIFKTGDVPGVIVETEANLQNKQRNQIYQNFGKYMDSSEKGNPILLLEGGIKLASRNFTIKDIQNIHSLKLSREDLCAIFGVPPATAGIYEYANYANTDQQRQILFEQTLIPLFDSYTWAHQVMILDVYFPGYKIKPNYDTLPTLLIVLEKKTTIAEKMFRMGVPINEINRRLDMGLNEISGGDIGYVNGLPATSIGGAAAPTPTEEEPGEGEEGTAKTGGKMLNIIRNKMNPSDPFFHRYIENIVKLVYAPFTVRTQKVYDSFVKTMGKNIAEQIRKSDSLEGFKVNTDKWGKLYVDVIRPIVEELAIRAVYYLDVEMKSKNIQKLYLEGMAKAIPNDLTLEDLLSEEELAAMWTALDKTLNMAKTSITVTFANEIKKVVQAGIIEKLSIPEIANNIQEVTITRTAFAITNAQTLVTSAYNSARVQAYKKYKIRYHYWMDVGDSKVRDSHQMETAESLNGGPTRVGQPFPVTGLLFPGDPAGPPEEVCNCRCTTIAASPTVIGQFFPELG